MPDVKVNQKDGPITVAVDGGEPVTRYVQDHIVAVADDDLDHFLRVVEGSSVVSTPDTSKKGK